MVTDLPAEDGLLFCNFEESFARRFAGQAAPFTQQNKALIKNYWITAVRQHYLSGGQRTKLLKIGTGPLKTAAPLDHATAILTRALQNFHDYRMSEIQLELAAFNAALPNEQRSIRVAAAQAVQQARHVQEQVEEEGEEVEEDAQVPEMPEFHYTNT